MATGLNRREFGRGIGAATLLAAAGGVPAGAAAAYPDHAVTLIASAPAGGGTDVIARLLGRHLEKQMGVPMVVENHGGGAGVVGGSHAARLPADGYNLLVTFDGHVIGPITSASPTYDPIADFTPISVIATSAIVLLVRPDHPATDLPGFIAWAKAQGAGLNGGVPGANSPFAPAARDFVKRAGIEAELINNNGSSQTLLGLISGDYDFAFTSTGAANTHLSGGTLRALGVSTAEASPLLPGVAPIASVLPGYEYEVWYGVLAPAKLDPAIRDRLAQEVAKAVRSPEMAEALKRDGSTPIGDKPGDFAARLEKDVATWKAFAGK